MENLIELKQDSNHENTIETYHTLIEAARTLYDQRISDSTKRVYKSDWEIFKAWCNQHHLNADQSTTENIALFLTAQFKNGTHPSTLQRRLAAIRFWFFNKNMPSPTENHLIVSLMKGIRRDKQAKPKSPKKPAVVSVLKKMVDTSPPNTLRGIRDRAILLLGFAGGYRRSEITAINIEDLSYNENGMDVSIQRSKTDQEGKGDIKAILKGTTPHYCPIIAVQTWIQKSKIISGPLFRGITKSGLIKQNRMAPDVIYQLMKRCALQAGLNFEDYSPHSLRSGFTTSAIENSAKITKVMSVTKHKSMKNLQSYILHAERYEQHPAKGLL